MLDIGERLSSYEPLWENWYKDSFIGGGNFGKVYRLKQNFFGETRYSAVKIIPIILIDELNSLKDGKAEFIENKKSAMVQEIKNMYKLKGQDHLVQCLAHSIKDIFDDNGNMIGFDVLIQMEYYISLPQYIREKGELTASNVEKLGLHIASGLRAMHEINMLHRDIKIENIFVDQEDNYLLGDFGISKQEAQSSYSTLAGTQPFIAPEVWKVQHTKRRYTKTADIYSFGISLYYLMNCNMLPLVTTGSTQNDIDNAVFDRLNGKQFGPPRNGSDKLKTIVMKCCEYEPENRFQSINEVLAALEGKIDVQVNAQKASAQDTYATMYADNDDSIGRDRYNHPVRQQYETTPSSYGTPYTYPTNNDPNYQTPAHNNTMVAANGSNKIMIALISIVAVLLLALIIVILIFALRNSDNKNDSKEQADVTVTAKTEKENSVEETSSEADTVTTTTTAPDETTTTAASTTMETTTTTRETTTTTKATTAKKPEKIKTLKQPENLYAGIEEGDVYYYEGTGYTLYYGPDENKYDKTSISISSYDIIQEHGRLKDGSWLYVSVYGSNESGWIKNNSLSEFTEYPGMSNLTGYLSPGYFGKIIKDSAFRRGPNKIRDAIPNCNTIYSGSSVEVIGSCPGWYYISYGSYEGWVSSDNVELTGER